MTPSTWGALFWGVVHLSSSLLGLAWPPVRSLDTVLVTLCDSGICPSSLPDYLPVTLHTVSGQLSTTVTVSVNCQLDRVESAERQTSGHIFEGISGLCY